MLYHFTGPHSEKMKELNYGKVRYFVPIQIKQIIARTVRSIFPKLAQSNSACQMPKVYLLYKIQLLSRVLRMHFKKVQKALDYPLRYWLKIILEQLELLLRRAIYVDKRSM